MLSAREIMDMVAREFELVRIKRNIDKIDDVEQLREIAKQLIDLMESQRRAFHNLTTPES